LNVRAAAPALSVIASGGLRDGIDVAKCVALGAQTGGLASPFLKAAAVSLEATVEAIEGLARELRIAMFAAGAGSIRALQQTPLVKV
jgi:isopentenyl-diphosphate delta-isomerase